MGSHIGVIIPNPENAPENIPNSVIHISIIEEGKLSLDVLYLRLQLIISIVPVNADVTVPNIRRLKKI